MKISGYKGLFSLLLSAILYYAFACWEPMGRKDSLRVLLRDIRWNSRRYPFRQFDETHAMAALLFTAASFLGNANFGGIVR